MTRTPLQLFVAVDGDDRWSGQLPTPNAGRSDGPLGSLTGARNAIRQIKHAAGLQRPVEVNVRGGTHRLAGPLQLWGGDSGTAACPITYMAYPGEQPVLSGGRPVTGWQRYRDKIVCADLPDVRAGRWWFRQLFYHHRRMIRARQPKHDSRDPLYGGWAFIETLLPDTVVPGSFEKKELDLIWRFKIDPEKRGTREQWFSPQLADADWQGIRVDETWQRQGYSQFHGTAWYRLSFTMPQDFDQRRHLWLSFGAVDKEAHVYIDGQMVFEHTVAATGRNVEQLWNEPFRFDARPYLTPGRRHVIAVRVDSEAFSGGIWMPVWLVSADAEISDEILHGSVPRPTVFRFEENVFPHRWARPQQAEVFVIPGKSWVSDIIPIKKVDVEKRAIYLTRPAGHSAHEMGTALHLVAGNRFYVENNLEDLTEPGEWCLDQDNGTLYFWPPDEKLDCDAVVAPVTTRLIQMIGSHASPLQHVSIKGFTFRHTQMGWPTEESYYKTPNAGQTVYLENTQDCAVEDSFFDAVGGDAIRLQGANARNRITGNIIAEAGAYGIFVGSVQRGFDRHDTRSGDVPGPVEWTRLPEDRAATVAAWPRSSQHLIANNRIHHVGRFEKHAQGIAFFGVSAVDVVVAHNLIHDTPRFGIGLMSGFGSVTIEYNDLYNISQETCDTGGICFNRWYTHDQDADLSRGCVVRFNRVRDVIGCGAYGRQQEAGGSTRAGGRIWAPYYSWAIYFDNAPMDVLVHGNICARNTLGGLMISHYGRNVTIENNIFVDSDRSQAYMLLAGKMSNIRIRRNIFCYSHPEADFLRLNLGYGIDLTQVLTEFDYNVLHHTAGRELTLDGLPGEAAQRTQMAVQEMPRLANWQKLGFDAHSVIAEPGFVDPAHDNYDLKPDSPALRLGFVPIDAGLIGPVDTVPPRRHCLAVERS